MPDVTPAAVQTVAELRRKIGSRSTVTSGNSRAIRSANAQCVVARQPSSRPAWAARNDPVQTLTTRRELAAAVRIQAMVAGSRRASSTPAPPGRTRVSMSCGSGIASATNARLVLVVTGRPSREATVTRYPPSVSIAAPVNTSCGPTRSSACTPGNPRITTDRAMSLSVEVRGDGV